MAITKQDFYEGAALNLVARTGKIAGIINRAPFYILNGGVAVLLKYSTKGRSPWGFTVTESEQSQLSARALKSNTAIGLICGSDGVVALNYQSFLSIASPRSSTIHISCYRDHGEHYEVSGPDGKLPKKIAPSSWQRILEQ
ncbi:MAG TPA: hypothetical protein VIJ78_10710 [Pseudolabrys sp.]